MTVQSRTSTVVIYQGDDLEQIAHLRRIADTARRKVDAQKKAGTSRGGGDTSAIDAEAAHDTFVAQAADRAVVVHLRAIGRKQWRALLAEHPPRYEERKIEDAVTEVMHPDDAGYSVNTETFGEALLRYRNPNRTEMRTVTEPTFTPEELEDFLDDLSAGDFQRLWATAYGLNGSLGGDPRDFTYSTTTPTSG